MPGRIEYQVGVKTDDANKALQGLEGSVRNVAAAWLTMQGAAEAFDLAKQAAQVRDATAVFQAAGGNIQDLRAATRGMISDAELIKKSNLAETMGIPRDAFAELARVAEASAKKTGQSFDFLFESIIVGSARQSKQILDNLGILVSVEKANSDYAESLKKTTRELTDAEKKQAFLNEVLRQGRPLIEEVALSGASASDKYAQFEASIENLKTSLGGFVDVAGQTWMPILNDLATLFDRITGRDTRSAQEKAVDAIAPLKARAAELRDILTTGGVPRSTTMDQLLRGAEGIAEANRNNGIAGGVRVLTSDERDRLSRVIERLDEKASAALRAIPKPPPPKTTPTASRARPRSARRGSSAVEEEMGFFGPGQAPMSLEMASPFGEEIVLVEEEARKIVKTFGDDMPAAVKKAADEIQTLGEVAGASLDTVAGSVAHLGADMLGALITGQAAALDQMVAEFLFATGQQLVANSILHGFNALATGNAMQGGVAVAEFAAGTMMMAGSLPLSASSPGAGVSSGGVNRGRSSSSPGAGGGGPTSVTFVYGVGGPNPEDAARAVRDVTTTGGRLLGDGIRRGRR